MLINKYKYMLGGHYVCVSPSHIRRTFLLSPSFKNTQVFGCVDVVTHSVKNLDFI